MSKSPITCHGMLIHCGSAVMWLNNKLQSWIHPPENPPRASRFLFKNTLQREMVLNCFSLWPKGWSFLIVIERNQINCTCASVTNPDGRCTDLLPPRGGSDAIELKKGGTYKVIFKTKDYFAKTDRKCFYPWVEVCITCPIFGQCSW